METQQKPSVVLSFTPGSGTEAQSPPGSQGHVPAARYAWKIARPIVIALLPGLLEEFARQLRSSSQKGA